MYTKNQRKKRAENMEVTTGERDTDEEEDDDSNRNRQLNTSKNRKNQQRRDLVISTNDGLSSSRLAAPTGNDKPAAFIAQLLHEADLGELTQLDNISQIKYFLDERGHLNYQMELIHTQYEKQYSSMKHRLDETETENERLTSQHRTASKELILYRNLVEAPDSPSSSTKAKDYQQFKLTIDNILQENQRLYAELHHFKTSDPVYEQVQLLEISNKTLQQELLQLRTDNSRLKKLVNIDEIKHLQLKLTKTLEECDQLRLINSKLLQQYQQQTSSPKQVHLQPPLPLSNQQQQLSPISRRSSKSTNANSSHLYSANEVNELREQVQRLEKLLHKRDYELEKLQNEIEKGTSSIMSSIEDLYIVSSNVSSSANMLKHKPTIEELQNELDQLHDKLDEVIRENQILKNRTQEFDTIYEENEYLYAEKSKWNEEVERSKIRHLILEQEIHTLREREKEFILINDPSITTNNSNSSQLKLKIDWLNHTNNQLELEVVRSREQTDFVTQKYEQAKRDLIAKNQHYKQILEAAQDTQKLPQELARIEKLNNDLETQFEHERQEYEKTIAELEEQSEKREQKYSSLYDTILKLQNDYRQRELDFTHEMVDIAKQRDSFQNGYEKLQQENKSLKEEMNSKNEINHDLKAALTSANNDSQTIYNQFLQLNTNITELQQNHEHDLNERNSQIENLRSEQEQIIANYDVELLKTHQISIQLQHDNNQYLSQLEHYQPTVEKLQTEINQKQNFIEQIQNDLTDRSALHVSINNQLAQENQIRMVKITEFEQALSQEKQRKIELQRTIQDLQTELLKSRTIAKDSLEKCEDFERRFRETDKNCVHLNETTEPTKRELNTIRSELITKSDQNTELHHTLEDEKLKRQRLEIKLKRLKDEYINVRKDLYSRIEENNTIQHELVECRLKLEYYAQMNNPTFQSLRPSTENQASPVVQLYLKEKGDSQHYQLKCQTYHQKVEQLQKHYELLKEKYKQRLHEEREVFENTKLKYLDHIKNVQKDLQETRQLLEKDADLKISQESAYQQLIDERRQLLTSMVDKDAKVREMRRENLLLTSKIQLLENQMESLNDRVDQTLRERSQLRRDISVVRLDSNVSVETSAHSSPIIPSARSTITYIDSKGWTLPVCYTDSFGFKNGHPHETSAIS